MARHRTQSRRKRGGRGGGGGGGSFRQQMNRYPNLADYFSEWRRGKTANVYGGRQSTVVTPAAGSTVIPAGAPGAVTQAILDPTEGGLLTHANVTHNIGGGLLEVTAFSHNNVSLIVRQVPVEIFSQQSRINPLVGRVAVRSDSLFLDFQNNDAVNAATCWSAINQEPWLYGSPGGTKGRSIRPSIEHGQENSIVAVGSNQGRTNVLAAATQVFTVTANTPLLAQNFYIVTDGNALAELEVTAFAIDNRNQMDGGSINAVVFDPTSITSPIFQSFLEPADVVSISIVNTGANPHNVQCGFTTRSP